MRARMTAKRLRLLGAVAAVAGLAVFFGSGWFRGGVWLDGGVGKPSYKLWVGGGTIGFFRNNWQVSGTAGLRGMVRRYGFHGLETPWRPYHTASGRGWGVGTEHGLVVPLWPWPIVAIGVALYAHGLVRGARMRGRCERCGYDLRGLESDKCPECGVRSEQARGQALTGPTSTEGASA